MDLEDLDPNAALELCSLCRCRYTIVHCVDCEQPACDNCRIRLSQGRAPLEYQCYTCRDREQVPAQPKW